jgi:hypothetical protein
MGVEFVDQRQSLERWRLPLRHGWMNTIHDQSFLGYQRVYACQRCEATLMIRHHWQEAYDHICQQCGHEGKPAKRVGRWIPNVGRWRFWIRDWTRRGRWELKPLPKRRKPGLSPSRPAMDRVRKKSKPQ